MSCKVSKKVETLQASNRKVIILYYKPRPYLAWKVLHRLTTPCKLLSLLLLKFSAPQVRQIHCRLTMPVSARVSNIDMPMVKSRASPPNSVDFGGFPASESSNAQAGGIQGQRPLSRIECHPSAISISPAVEPLTQAGSGTEPVTVVISERQPGAVLCPFDCLRV
ncbi:hypothetical protein BC827DRAFT_910336 [Russula dissimulans]|nr:hypothetical protein BC827DRAFT_910336 [Russula dissimulans]